MSMALKLAERARARKPIRVGLIGAGKFGAMFLSQALRTLAPGGPAPVSRETLEGLRNALSYPAGFDSPKNFEPPAPGR